MKTTNKKQKKKLKNKNSARSSGKLTFKTLEKLLRLFELLQKKKGKNKKEETLVKTYFLVFNFE